MKVLLSWSSGKDCAWALHVLRARGVDVVGLLTTVRDGTGRVAMHDVRPELLAAQAAAVGLPLRTVALPDPCPNDAYERAMGAATARARDEGVSHVAFGDLFLEDVRAYREAKLAGTGIAPLFPLWGRDTRVLAREMIDAGLRAIVATVDPRRLDPSFCGRAFDASLLADLPPDVDPCGERGELHTFAFAGPPFARPIPVTLGERHHRDGFVHVDLLPP